MKKYSILIIDDEEAITASLGFILEKEGYNVFTAPSGEVGIEIFMQERPHLVITDLRMGGISGLEVVRKIKEAEPETMAIILTGFGEMDSAIEALRLGASDYLLKPCQKEELLFKLESCVEKLKMKLQIKAFETIIPVCCVCRKIRDETNKEHGTGRWMLADEYIERHSELESSHTYCDDCIVEAKKEAKRIVSKHKAKK